MRELSIEEKAKAYDKAIERANDILKGYNPKEGSKATINYIFPELEENKDDKVRKELINYLKYRCNSTTLSGEERECKEWIAWLEKQDEKEFTFKSIPRLLEMIEPTDRAKAYCQKLIDSLIKEGYVIDAMIVGECLKQMNGEDVPMATMDEQKPYGQRKECLDCQFNYAGECKGSCQIKRDEQKPIEWKQENREELTEFENAMMHIGGSFFGENAGLDPNDTAAIKEQAELLLKLAPKQEWSEEDEDMVRYIGNAITCEESAKYLEEKGVDMIKAHRWLESFKPQSNQEWSEEDEEHLNSIISDLKTDMGAYPRSQEVIDIYNDDISFLNPSKTEYNHRISLLLMKSLLKQGKMLIMKFLIKLNIMMIGLHLMMVGMQQYGI